MAIGSALSVGLIGLKAFIIQIQAFVSPGLPYFSIIGLPDTSLSEARERVKSACQASGAGNTGYSQSFAGVHAQTRILTRSGDRSERA